MTDELLPALPEPRFWVDSMRADMIRPESLVYAAGAHLYCATTRNVKNDEPIFTADQLRAYAREAIRQAQGEVSSLARDLPDVVIGRLSRYRGFDSWWGDIDEDDSNVILHDLEASLRNALIPSPPAGEVA